jgi:excisionase family DNA binding protein
MPFVEQNGKNGEIGTMSQEPDADSFYTSREAAAALDVSVKTIQLWAENGVLSAWKTPGGHRRITRSSVAVLLAQRREQTSTAATHDPRSPDPSGRKRVLVVEDDVRARRLYQITLSHWGLPIELILATDGFEGLLRVGERKPDVLVTDLDMPGMDGFRLIDALRNDTRYQSTQIVVVSGMSTEQIHARGGLPTGIPLLPKPIPFSELRRLIEQTLLDQTASNAV